MSLSRNTLTTILNEVTQWATQADIMGEPWHDGEWAPYIKAALGAAGTEKGYTPYYTIPDIQSEFLYDLIWVRENEGERIVSVPLVAEIEWGNQGDVWDDFQKLLVARAGVRVMVFNGWPGLLEELQAHVHQYAHGGDRYLFAQYTLGIPEHEFVVVESVKQNCYLSL